MGDIPPFMAYAIKNFHFVFRNPSLIQRCTFVGKTVLSALESKLDCDRNSLFKLDSTAIISAVRTT